MQARIARSFGWHIVCGYFVVALLSLCCCFATMAQAQSAAMDNQTPSPSSNQAQKMLTSSDLRWLHKHGKIRMAYISNLLGNCARDPATGELVGSLATYVERARTCFANETLEFAPYAYPTIEAELAAFSVVRWTAYFPCTPMLSKLSREDF
ncbi:MAG: hypothetical protein Q4P09_02330 [Phascolarctobacterium sp.]|nr:hypothetical protein [Phascolarctobacterium sp.]